MREQHRRQLAYQVQQLCRKGASQRAIARALGIARRTVKRLLDEIEDRREEGESAIERQHAVPRTPKPSMLDPYENKIRAWLLKWPKLKATRCHEKLL